MAKRSRFARRNLALNRRSRHRAPISSAVFTHEFDGDFNDCVLALAKSVTAGAPAFTVNPAMFVPQIRHGPTKSAGVRGDAGKGIPKCFGRPSLDHL